MLILDLQNQWTYHSQIMASRAYWCHDYAFVYHGCRPSHWDVRGRFSSECNHLGFDLCAHK